MNLGIIQAAAGCHAATSEKFEDRAEGARERESLREPQNNRKVPITLDQVLICVCMRGKLWC